MNLLQHDVPCAVDNCGMNGISSVRIDDNNWFTLCVFHSSSEHRDFRLYESALDNGEREVYEDDCGDWQLGPRPIGDKR